MDVICDRCDTVYEFDETLLSGKGTPVKCTNCGHVFKVYPQAAAASEPTASTWRLRLSDGSVDTIETLRELQRRISDGELKPENQIARGDEDWKTLGSIPELDTFFQAAGVPVSGRIPSPLPPIPAAPRKDSSLPPGVRQRQPTLLGVSPVQRMPVPEAAPEVPLAPEPASTPEPGSASESTSTSRPESEISLGGRAESTGSAAERSYRSPYTRDSSPTAAAAEIEDAEFEESIGGDQLLRTSTPPPFYDDDDDIPELPSRGTSAVRWLLAILVIGGLALVVVEWERVVSLLGVGGDPAAVAAAISAGDAALDEGHPDGYSRAISAYRRALEAGASQNPELLAKLSNAYALAAQTRLDAGNTQVPVPFATEAMSTATAAADLDGARLDAKLALVDALRLNGAEEEAREQLEEVREMPFSRTPEFYRVDARLSQAEADGQLQSGLRSARQAAEIAPESPRYLLLQARAELAAGNVEPAEQTLQSVLLLEPAHPVATSLMQAVAATESEPESESEPASETEPESEPASETEPETEPESASETETETETETEPETETETEPEPESATESETKPGPGPRSETPRPRPRPRYDEYDRLTRAAASDAFIDGRPPVTDYETNMAKGREALGAGNYARARAYFDSALEVHPGSADAMDALGDVATAVSDYGSATRYYRVAAQRGHPDGYFKLGESYERLGRNEEAVSAYYTYIMRRPDGPHASDARRKIRTLEPRAILPSETKSPAGAKPSDETSTQAPPSTSP